jgi:hypothetical protein
MKRSLLITALFVSIATISSAKVPDSPQPPPGLADLEFQVIAVAVTQLYTTKTTKWFYISNRTTTFECDPPAPTGLDINGSGGMRTKNQGPRDVFNELASNLSGLTPELFMDFYSKTQSTTVVEKTLPINIKQAIWGPTSTTDLPKEWGNPDFSIYHSRVGFNDTKTQALVYVASTSWVDVSKSGGEYVLLTLKNSKWVVSSHYKKWSLL